MGVPIKFYFGNQNYENQTNFYDFRSVTDMIERLKESYRELQESAN